MYTLGEIAGAVWPMANIPRGIQATLLSRPYEGLRLMREHEAYREVPIERLCALLDRVPTDFCVPAGGPTETQLRRFWAGFIGDETLGEPTMATDKQINYALALLRKKGYPTTYMSMHHKDLATMRERSGTVDAWLRSKNVADLSALIDKLKALPDA